MKVIVVGKSKYRDAFQSALRDAELEPVAVETAAGLKNLPEELPVVLLYDANLSPLIMEEGAAEKAVSVLKPQDAVVFLMDRDEDANPHIEYRVLETASRLASAKRRVTVLLRSCRAPDERFDDLYRIARQKGVTFIRYESLDITENEGIYTVVARDGKLSVSIDTPLLVDCGEKPSWELQEFSDALRLRTYDGGRISGNRWFLNQGATFKRNVRLVDTAALSGDIQRIMPALVKDILALEKPAQEKTAFVDAEKCAFCYTCFRVCPHSALGPDHGAAAMKVNDLLCEACGICVAICPASAIEFKAASPAALGDKPADAASGEPAGAASGDKPTDDTLGNKPAGAAAEDRRRTAEVPKETAGGKLKIFCCENSAFIIAKEALAGTDVKVESVPCGKDIEIEPVPCGGDTDIEPAPCGVNIDIDPVPCGGAVNAAMMANALRSHDRVMVAVCCEDACRHRDGNKRCIKQVERLKSRLDSLGYDSGRLSYVRTGVTMVEIFKEAALKALAGGEMK